MKRRVRLSVKHEKVTAMWLIRTIRSQAGQSLLEYATVAAVVSAAVIAMSTYVFRSVQATQQVIEQEFQKE